MAAQEFIQERVIANFAKCDATYGKMVATKVAALKKKMARSVKKADAKAAPLNPPRSVSKSNL